MSDGNDHDLDAPVSPRRRTCLGVASSVAHGIEGRDHEALVVVGVELELGLGVVAVLHQRHLGTPRPQTVI